MLRAALALIAFGPVALAAAVAPLAQTADPLPDSVRALLQVELREMLRADQFVRYQQPFGLFSPCRADSLKQALSGLSVEDRFAREAELKAEADARTSDAEKAVLLQMMIDTDARTLVRLRRILDAHGWPAPERTGSDVNPVVFLLHTPPDSVDALRPQLLAEVRAGRMPARHFAAAVDKSRIVRGLNQLYGSGQEFDPETQALVPPRVDDIEATNAARREIGLGPLVEYRTVGGAD